MKEATGEIDWDLVNASITVLMEGRMVDLAFSIPLVLSFCGEWGRGKYPMGLRLLRVCLSGTRSR